MPIRAARLAPLLAVLALPACRASAPADLVVFGHVWTADTLAPARRALPSVATPSLPWATARRLLR